MNSYLLAADFDGTLFDTWSKSPNGIAFPQAYQASMGDVFGPQGLAIYHSIGGQQDRATDELVRLILQHGSAQELLANAQSFLMKEGAKLQNYVSAGEGAPLVWNPQSPVRVITELITRQKIRYLTDEIGTRMPDGSLWPQPIEGLLPFLDEIHTLNTENKTQFHIDLGVISAGHDMKVIKAFDIWNLPRPSIIISDDDIRVRNVPRVDFPTDTTDSARNERNARTNAKNRIRRTKPGLIPFALLHQDWLAEQGFSGLHEDKKEVGYSTEQAVGSKQRIMFFGDDPIRDGGLARGARVPFGLIKPGVEYESQPEISQITFSNWRKVSEVLSRNTAALREGRPLGEIFFGQRRGIESQLPSMKEGSRPRREL